MHANFHRKWIITLQISCNNECAFTTCVCVDLAVLVHTWMARMRKKHEACLRIIALCVWIVSTIAMATLKACNLAVA